MLKLRHRLLAGLLATTLSCSPVVMANYDLPDIGAAGSSALSIAKEQQYGEAFTRIANASMPLIQDPVLTTYVQQLGAILVGNAEGVMFPFEFFLVKDDEINAAAYFGGRIIVHSGLFTYADNESQLASVLAHEIAHVTQRHLARMLEDQARRQPVTLAALAGAVLLSIAAPGVGIAALQTAVATDMQMQINFTRQNESEADRIGIQILADSGFNPQEMAGFFGKLAEKYRYASKPPAMLLTHPLPESRIAEARARAARLPVPPLKADPDFLFAKARIGARYSRLTANQSIAEYQRLLKGANTVSTELADSWRYGLALALLAQGKQAESQAVLEKLLIAYPNNMFVLDAWTDLAIETKTYDDARTRLNAQLKRNPNNRSALLNLIYLEQKAGNYAVAEQIVEPYLRKQPNDILAWGEAISIYNALGKLAERHHARAEWSLLRAEFAQASQELHSAIAHSSDKMQRARYQARLAQIEQLAADFDELQQ